MRRLTHSRAFPLLHPYKCQYTAYLWKKNASCSILIRSLVAVVSVIVIVNVIVVVFVIAFFLSFSHSVCIRRILFAFGFGFLLMLLCLYVCVWRHFLYSLFIHWFNDVFVAVAAVVVIIFFPFFKSIFRCLPLSLKDTRIALSLCNLPFEFNLYLFCSCNG